MLQPAETRKALPTALRPRISREEAIDLKRKRLNLRQAADLMLPANVILMTDTPIQAVRKGLICRIFTLRGTLNSGRWIEQHFQYFHEIADHIQMQWAAKDIEERMELENMPSAHRNQLP